MTLWTTQYLPRDFSEFVGNVEIVDSVRKWAEAWERGQNGKPLLFFGSTGTGKTCLALLVAKQFGWETFELNASDFRSKDIIERLAGTASQGASLSGGKRLVLLDEIDGLQARDRGGAAAIAKILKEAHNPVILTANNIYKDQKLLSIRQQCQLFQFKKINYLSIAKRLRELLEAEGMEFDPEAIKLLAKNCGGDFRSALLDTQTLSMGKKISIQDVESLGYRERQQNVFKVVEAIFKGRDMKEIRKVRFQSEVRDDLLFRWVEENIPRIYSPEDAANAFNALSRADIFEGRIFNRQHYGFKRYSSELFSSGVALAKKQEYHGWLKLQFPQLLKKLSASSSARNLKKELAKKIGERTHSSSRAVSAEDLPFLKILVREKENAVNYAAAFDLNEKEIAFLLATKPATKKVQSILEKAQELKQKELLAKRKPLEAIPENSLKHFEEQEGPEEPKPEETKEDHKQTRLF